MDLVYLWIDGYKNLKNCGANLNARYICELENVAENGIQLQIYEDKNFYNIFGKNINVKTIVGQNGSGKSNLVNALSYILRRMFLVKNIKYADRVYDEDDLGNSRYCLVFMENNCLYYFSTDFNNIIKHSSMQIVNVLRAKERLDCRNKLSNLPYPVAKFQPFLKREDDNYLEFPIWNNIFNSTKIKLENYFYYDRFRLYDTTRNLLEFYMYSKRRKEPFKLLCDSENLKFDSYSPYLNLYSALQWTNSKIQRLKNYNYNITQVISYSVRKLSSYVQENSYQDVNRLSEEILPKLFFNYAIGEVINVINNSHIDVSSKIESCINAFPENIYPDMAERIRFYDQLISLISDERIKEMLQAYKLYEENSDCKDILREKFESGRCRQGVTLQLKSEYMIDIDDYDNLPEDIAKIEQLKGINKNLYRMSDKNVYDFMSLSTGEQRIMRFFADVYVAANLRELDKCTTSNTNVFLFDEMDLSWHPQWQRKMVLYILDVLESVCSSRNINLIFTTHSPFILSDMPVANVLRICNGEVQKNTQKTFGANIYDLFKDFFENCDNGCTIGEFASSKIKEIVHSAKNASYKQKEEYQKIIDMIGEPIIKKQLERIFTESELETLKRENEMLRQELNAKNNTDK